MGKNNNKKNKAAAKPQPPQPPQQPQATVVAPPDMLDGQIFIATRAPVPTAAASSGSPTPQNTQQQQGSGLTRAVFTAPDLSSLHHASSEDSLFRDSSVPAAPAYVLTPLNASSAAAAASVAAAAAAAGVGRRHSTSPQMSPQTYAKRVSPPQSPHPPPPPAPESPTTMKMKQQQHRHQQHHLRSPSPRAASAAADEVEGSFVALLSLSADQRSTDFADADHPAGTDAASQWNKLLRLFGGLVLVSKVQWQNVLLWIASYQYIPLMAAVCVTTANALMAVAATAILPVFEYDAAAEHDGMLRMEGAASETSSSSAASSALSMMTTLGASFFEHSTSGGGGGGGGSSSSSSSPEDVSTSMAQILFSASFGFFVILGTAVCGYKAASMIGDAFIDSCRVVADRRSGHTLLLYSLFQDCCRVFALGPKYVAVFTALLLGIPGCLLWSVLNGRYGIDRRPAFVAAFISISFEVSWLIFQICRFVLRVAGATHAAKQKKASPHVSPLKKTDPPKNEQEDETEPTPTFPLEDGFEALQGNVKPQQTELTRQLCVWWSRKIPKIRKRGFFFLFLTAIVISVASGLQNGMVALVEGFLYVSVVHLSAHIAARTTLFIRAAQLSVQTIAQDTAALVSTLIVGPALLAIAITNCVRFGLALGVIQLPVLVLAMCSVASHATDVRQQLRSRSAFAASPLTPSTASTSRRSFDDDDDYDDTDADEGSNSSSGKKNKSSKSSNSSNMLRRVWVILSRVALFNARRSFDYGAHWRYARVLRVTLRVFVATFVLAVSGVAVCAAVQAAAYDYSKFQTRLVRVEVRAGGAGLDVYSDTFRLRLDALSGNDDESSAAAASSSSSSKSKTKKERPPPQRYQGMCQRKWLSPDNVADISPANDNGSLFVGDMAFFSMLSYVAPMDEQNSRNQLFDFYREHRAGARGWEIVDPVRDVWEPLRALQAQSVSAAAAAAAAAAKAKKQRQQQPQNQQNQHQQDEEDEDADSRRAVEQERRDVLRWSRLHLVQSLRAPFLHFRRPRNSTGTGTGSGSGTGTGHDNLFVVRGTELNGGTLGSDFFQNGIIFADVFLIEQLAHFVPGVGLLPMEFVRDLVSATNFIARPPDALFYHSHLKNYMRAVRALHHKTRDRDGYCATGHSLGGVVSSLAAPALQIPAVALSAPGIAYMSRKFSISTEDADSFVTNIVVSNDLVPLIGTIGGSVENCECEHPGSSLMCHSLQLSFWRNLHHCGAFRSKFSSMRASYTITRSEVVEWLHSVNRLIESVVGFPIRF